MSHEKHPAHDDDEKAAKGKKGHAAEESPAIKDAVPGIDPVPTAVVTRGNPRSLQPHDPAFEAPPAGLDTERYQVMHAGVGQWRQGDVVSRKDLRHVDLARLLTMGAVVPIFEPPATEDPDDDAG